MRINWQQFISTVAAAFTVGAGGAALTVMITQASTEQRVTAHDVEISAIKVSSGAAAVELNRTLNEMNTRLSRIEGKLDAK